MSDLSNQHNNGSHQYQVFGNTAALCLALWAKNRIRLGGEEAVVVVGGIGGAVVGGGDLCDALNRLFMKGAELSLSLFLSVCLSYELIRCSAALFAGCMLKICN